MYSKAKTLVGKKALINVSTSQNNQLEIEVRIRDFKVSYGRERFLVEPINGKGEIWVQEPRMIGA